MQSNEGFVQDGYADRVVVLGFDCGAPGLFFERWAADLPHLSALRERGQWGRLRSCHPPITVPAWRIMASGMHAGAQGVYGFRNRTEGRYDLAVVNGDAFVAEPIWNVLAKDGLTSTLVGVPGTFPITSYNVTGVAGFMAPDIATAVSSPAVEASIAGLAHTYALDVAEFRSLPPGELIDRVWEMTQARIELCLELLACDDWNLFWMVEIGLDRLYHALWHHLDAEHPRFEGDPRLVERLKAYHVLLDTFVGDVVALCDDGETAFFVVSDHGARAMEGGFRINTWLESAGYLVVREGTPVGARFEPQSVDWERTRVWAAGGYYARLFVNVEGREPHGIVPQAAVDSLLDEVCHRLSSVRRPGGELLGVELLKPRKFFDPCSGLPPDGMVYLADLAIRALDDLNGDTLFTHANNTGFDAANHDWDGLYVAAGAGVAPRGEGSASLLELAGYLKALLLD